MHILPIIKTQRQMAGQMTSVSLAPTDPVVPPMSVGQRPQSNMIRLRRRELHKVGATKAACVDAAAAYVDVAGITLTEGGRTR